MGGSSETRKAADLLKEANSKAIEAQNTQGALVQGKKFTDAIGLYQRVVNGYKNSPEAAESLLATGKIYAGLPVQSKPAPGQTSGFKQEYKSKIETTTLFVFKHEAPLQNDMTSRDTFRTLLQQFDSGKPYKQLVEDYGATDAARVQVAVDQAKVYEPWITQTADAKNRNDYRYKFMSLLVKATGSVPGFSYWFAMVLLAVIVKLIITPLTKAQFKSMKEMQRVQPLMKELQEKYKDNQQELGKKMMELYKEHGINPLSGCLPILIQMPVLFGVYSMIRTFELQFAKGTFLWIGFQPLVHKWAFNVMGGKPVWLTARSLAEPDLILLVLYTISMYVSSKISIVDPSQAEQQRMMSIMMPVMFFFLIGYLPSAFVFYWFMFNVLQTWQQYHIIHGGTTAAEPAAPATTPESSSSRNVSRRRRRR